MKSRGAARRWVPWVVLAMLLTTAPAAVAVAERPAAGPGTVVSASPEVVAPAARRPGKRADPRTRRPFFVDATMPAARAGASYAAIGRRAQARWFTDGAFRTPASVRAGVRGYTTRALRRKRTPVVVLYAIPARDCGGESSGGLPGASAYRAWVRAAAKGLRGQQAMVVLEPDAIPFATRPECGSPAARTRLLAFAVRELAKAKAWVYLDAGHSDWIDAATTARLLKQAGIGRARGFSVNVANHRPTAELHTWAGQVRSALGRLGVRNRRFVVDTSRNGSTAPVAGDWCNPTWARLGTPPRPVFKQGLDAHLWIKNPGESDGDCNGGPPAGSWWPAGADVLLNHS